MERVSFFGHRNIHPESAVHDYYIVFFTALVAGRVRGLAFG